MKKLKMNNCIFLHLVGGICPYYSKTCDKPCEVYSPIGDTSKPIFQDWDKGIKQLANEMKHKYFKDAEKESDELDVDDFLGGKS